MWLQEKQVVIYGGGGAIGGAVARLFAREGAHVHLAGRSQGRLDATAAAIRQTGGRVSVAQVDALAEHAIEEHVDSIIAACGRIDVTLNACGFMHVQGVDFLSLSYEDFTRPITESLRSNFLTARAVTKHMVPRRSGVILTLSTPGSRLSGSGYLGYGVTCAGVEAFTRILAGELGPYGIRTVCLRPDAIPETLPASYAQKVFEPVSAPMGMNVQDMLETRASTVALLKRAPTLSQVAHAALLAASDHGGAMTGAIMNLTCGSVVD